MHRSSCGGVYMVCRICMCVIGTLLHDDLIRRCVCVRALPWYCIANSALNHTLGETWPSIKHIQGPTHTHTHTLPTTTCTSNRTTTCHKQPVVQSFLMLWTNADGKRNTEYSGQRYTYTHKCFTHQIDSVCTTHGLTVTNTHTPNYYTQQEQLLL